MTAIVDAGIEALVATFYTAFDNRTHAPTIDRLRAIFCEHATITRVTGERVDRWTPDAFIAPRAAMLTDGTLTNFHEWETEAQTIVLQNIASRWSMYEKEGILDGADYRGRGHKFIQFLCIEGRWGIDPILWEDE